MTRHRFIGRATGVVAAMVLFLSAAAAQAQQAAPLADRVPADAVFYVGWSGSDNVPGFAGSHFESLLNNSNMREAFQNVVPQLIRRLQREDAEAAAMVQQVYDILGTVTRKPTALFIGGIGKNDRGDPMPRMGLICRVGAADAARLQEQIARLTADAPPEVMLRVSVSGDDLAVLIGYENADAALVKAGGDSLASAATFTGAMKQLGGNNNAAIAGWVNVERGLSIVDEIVQMEAPEEAKVMYDKVMDAIGLRGVKHAAFASGFDGKDWMGNMFLAAPAPRKGLVALMDGPPLSDELLRGVPMDAEVVMAGAFDVAQFVNQIRETAGAVDPQYKQFVDQGLGAAQMALGTPVLPGILEPLGPDWAVYTSRSVAGGGLPGVVVLNKPDDPAKAKQGLASLTIFANNMSNTFLTQEDVFVQARQLKVGDQDMYYVAVPFLAPSWSVTDGYAMFGLFPQTLIDARKLIKDGGKSILDNPSYQQLRQRLGAKDARGVFYADLPQTAADSYWLLLVVSRLAAFSDIILDVPTPPMLIPPYSVLKDHLSVAGGVTWVDDAGLHSRTVGPFPGAEMFQGTAAALPTLVAQAPMLASLGMPAMVRARGQAGQAQCSNNLRQIGLAANLYANENRGEFPPDFATMLKTQDILADVFFCPSGHHNLEQMRGMEAEQRAGWVNDNSDYVWVGAGKRAADGAGTVIAHDKPGNHPEGLNAVFADGHVEFMLRTEAEQRIPGIVFPPRR